MDYHKCSCLIGCWSFNYDSLNQRLNAGNYDSVYERTSSHRLVVYRDSSSGNFRLHSCGKFPMPERTPLMMSCQIYPSTIPPIRLGIKNAVRKKLVPRNPLVSNNARINASRLTDKTETTVNFTVNQKAFKKSLLSVKMRDMALFQDDLRHDHVRSRRRGRAGVSR